MNIYNKYFITNEEVLYKCKQLSTSFQQFYYNNYERKKYYLTLLPTALQQRLQSNGNI